MASGVSHFSAKSPRGILSAPSSTKLLKIKLSSRCETASVPIRGSKLVGIVSIKKLTTPGSVLKVREQEESKNATEKMKVKDIKEALETKETILRAIIP